MKYFIFLLLLTSCKLNQTALTGGVKTPVYQSNVFKASTIELPYRILVPNKITENTPITLFLHGAGERGTDNELQLAHGSQRFLDSIEKHPAIYVFPQCPSEGYWSNVKVDRTTYPINLNFESMPSPTPSMQAVLELLDMIIDEYDLKKANHKVIGLSMGGMGTFEILQHRPEYFDKAIAICGGGHQDWADKYSSNLSIWIAHGIDDNVVDIKESQIMFDAIKSKNIQVKFDQYPSVGHNSWDNLFADPDMLPWLFE